MSNYYSEVPHNSPKDLLFCGQLECQGAIDGIDGISEDAHLGCNSDHHFAQDKPENESDEGSECTYHEIAAKISVFSL